MDFGRAHDLRPAPGVTAAAGKVEAALMQAQVAWTLRSYLDWRILTRIELAARAGIPEKRLRRIMRGEIWAYVHDLVVIGRAAPLQLIQVRALTNRRPHEVEWRPPDHPDKPMLYSRPS